MIVRVLFFFCGLFFLTAGNSFAGDLFPPENASECKPGSLLTWSGDSVRCIDPFPVQLAASLLAESCGAGYLMRGITVESGAGAVTLKPICVQPIKTVASSSSCPSGSYATGTKGGTVKGGTLYVDFECQDLPDQK